MQSNTNPLSSEFYISDFIEHPVVPSFKKESFLLQKYLVEELSPAQIASSIGCWRTTIVRNLKTFGIPLRSEDKAHASRKAPAFGERLQDGKIVSCKRELEVIEMILKLHRQGLKLQAIADFLTSMKIPTKTQRGKWQASMV